MKKNQKKNHVLFYKKVSSKALYLSLLNPAFEHFLLFLRPFLPYFFHFPINLMCLYHLEFMYNQMDT